MVQLIVIFSYFTQIQIIRNVFPKYERSSSNKNHSHPLTHVTSFVEYEREFQTPRSPPSLYFVQTWFPSRSFTFKFNWLQKPMFRSYFVEDTANPWSPSSTYIQVGSLQNILTFAEKSGHIDRVCRMLTLLRAIAPLKWYFKDGEEEGRVQTLITGQFLIVVLYNFLVCCLFCVYVEERQHWRNKEKSGYELSFSGVN